MTKKLRKVGKVILYLLIGIFLTFVSLMFYVCLTERIEYLIVESVDKNVTITPRVVSEFILFNFRGGKKDISDMKVDNGGLNYIVSGLTQSKLSKEKKTKYIKYFISKGCGVNDVYSFDGLTPLHVAALFYDRDSTELLLENGADPFLRSKSPKGYKSSGVFNNLTPLEVAERANRKHPKEEYVKVIEILREAESKRGQKRLIN